MVWTLRQKKVYKVVIVFLSLILLISQKYILPNNAQSLAEEFIGAFPENLEPNGNTIEVNMEAKPGQVIVAENLALDTWSYNGQIPGPELRVKLGDTVRINFVNSLPQETTIHFHGIRVPNAMDGVPGVTQDPIPPGGTFVYEFTPKDAGTYWYHPHVRGSEQVERGLYGTMIVEDPDEPAYNRDTVIVLDDWLIAEDGQIDTRFNTGMDLMHDGRWGNLVTVNGSTNFSFSANPGERIRLRFVNTSNGRVYKLDFGELDARGIAVDGLLAREPFTAHGFEVAPGNRIDVDLSIPLISRSTPYFITDTFSRQTNNLITIYSLDQPISEARTFNPPHAEKFPDWEKAFDAPVDKEYRLNAREGGDLGIEWTINGRAFPDYEAISLRYADFNKIRLTNQSARLHPMHLHGQFFKVISRNGQPAEEGHWRDTVLLHPKEVVEIGLVPLDKGKWASHCHVLEHAEAGMMTIVQVE